MNNWNQLEARLRFWKPRRPSSRLEARLWGSGDSAARDLPTRAAWHWLAPAMAMCLLAMMMAGNSFPRTAYWGVSQPRNLIAAAALHDPLMASYYAGLQQNDHNILNATFEWTNGSYALGSAASLFDTNSSMP